MTRKLTLFLVCAFEIALILFVASWTAWAESNKLSSKNLLKLFPICEIPSSLGQRCKYDFKDTTPKNFIEVCCPNGHKISVNEKSVEVFSASEWLYRFDISYLPNDFVKIRFEDKAMNGGSYHTIAEFLAYLDNGKMQLSKHSTTRY